MIQRQIGTVVGAALLLCLLVGVATISAAQGPVVQQQGNPRTELEIGTRLTHEGSLQQAIPPLLAAQKAGIEPYATAVNLSICYLGTNQYRQAIATLEALRQSGKGSATVENLLAQSYLGNSQLDSAFAAFRRAVSATPKDEKMYAFLADACTDHQQNALGLRIVEMGLEQLPESARLHYERALFLARLDRFGEAKPEFDAASRLAASGYIGVLARVQKDLYEDNLKAATDLLYQAIRVGHRDYQTLSLLGSVLLYEGAAPGQPEFAEAQAALEESAKERPDYSATQIALGKLYLRDGRYADAAAHLEMSRRLEPNNPSIYASLANAYRRLAEKDKARQMEEQLARLLSGKGQSPSGLLQ